MKIAQYAHLTVLLSLLVCLISFAHWLLFVSVDFFWNGESTASFLIFLSAFFPGVFFAGTAWVYKRENRFSRALYLVGSLWLGTFIFLFLSMLFVWGIFWVGIFLGWNVPLGWIFSFCFGISLGIVAYGVYNAFHMRVRRVEVFIRSLPEYWEGKKIVQISDVHLGAIYGVRHFRKIASIANAEKPEIAAFTGDTFDGIEGSLSLFSEPLSSIRAKSGSFFIIGNHETYLGVEKVFRLLRKTRIHILDNAVADVHGLKVIGLSYPGRGKKKRFVKHLERLRSLYDGHPALLLLHTPERIKKISTMGISLQLSGHTHYGQITPFNVVTHIVHRGFDYGKYEIGDYTLYTTNGIGTWGPPIRFGNTPEIVCVTLRRKNSPLPQKKEKHLLAKKVDEIAQKTKRRARKMHASLKKQSRKTRKRAKDAITQILERSEKTKEENRE